MNHAAGSGSSGLKIIREPDRNSATKAGIDELRKSGASERLLKHAERALDRVPHRPARQPPS